MNVRRIQNKVEETLSLEQAIAALPNDVLFYQVENITFAPSDSLLVPYLWGLQAKLARGIVVHTGTKWHASLGIPAPIAQQASNVRMALYEEVIGEGMQSSDDLNVLPDYSVLETNGKYRRSVHRISRNSWGCCAHALGSCSKHSAHCESASARQASC